MCTTNLVVARLDCLPKGLDTLGAIVFSYCILELCIVLHESVSHYNAVHFLMGDTEQKLAQSSTIGYQGAAYTALYALSKQATSITQNTEQMRVTMLKQFEPWHDTIQSSVRPAKEEHHLDGTGTVAKGNFMQDDAGLECRCANGLFVIRLPHIVSRSVCVLFHHISLIGRP